MVYVECPNVSTSNKKSLFLAGGISQCRDWQHLIVSKLHTFDIVVYNPRRASFDHDNQDVASEQIIWEEEKMRNADIIVFYFCRETLCPITLYELGIYNMTSKPIIIGMDPDYSRRIDVEVQTKLKRPEVPIVYGVNNLLKELQITIINL